MSPAVIQADDGEKASAPGSPRSIVPTGNAEVFEMMENNCLPAARLYVHLATVISFLRSAFRSRAAVELEKFALRHQLNVLKRSVKHRPRLTSADRLLWVVLSRLWADWRSALTIVQPKTQLPGIAKPFACFGPGKFETVNRADLPSPARSAI
jgi:hypothetical protein